MTGFKICRRENTTSKLTDWQVAVGQYRDLQHVCTYRWKIQKASEPHFCLDTEMLNIRAPTQRTT